MKFIHAVWYLKSSGFKVEPTKATCKRGRFYRIYDPSDNVPPMLLLPRAITSLAVVAYNSLETTEGDLDATTST